MKQNKQNKENVFWKYFSGNNWIIPFSIIVCFIVILSFRLLSDPDLGFHLNAGRWILENLSFPTKDTFTYTSTQNDYIDLHWLFQVIIFFVYAISGYNGLSILVVILSVVLLFLLFKRNRILGIPLYFSCILFLMGFLIIEPRIVLRPEMFTFIFISIILLVLDNYYYRNIKQLYFLPVLMLVWCNMHSLFILGFALTGAYFISLWLKERKFDKYFFVYMFFSFAVCIINPYFFKGFTFPLELFTRFDSSNIFNQHLEEFRSFFQLDLFVFKNILFLIFIFLVLLSFLLTIRKRKLHELLLLSIFLYLAFISIRNISLFTIIAIPILGNSLTSITESVKIKFKYFNWNFVKKLIYFIFIIIPLLLILRLFTNSYYATTNSVNKTGIGIDNNVQPLNACEFIKTNKLNGRIINSLGYGGWLAWSTQQPVFIDGRLEVIKEALYNDVVESWNGGLSKLISKYNPDIIIYNYSKYYPWTTQLSEMADWRLIYLDGNSAIFAQKNYAVNIHEFDFSSLFPQYKIPENISDKEKQKVLNISPRGKFYLWVDGFFHKTDFTNNELLNISSFCILFKEYKIAERFLLEDIRRTKAANSYIYYALADIYKTAGDKEDALLCYHKILLSNPKNKMVLNSMRELQSVATDTAGTVPEKKDENEAKQLFNSGNKKYQNGDIKNALKDYDKAIALKPDYYKAYNNRGILKASEFKKDNEALKDFDKAIEINPDYADAYLGRGTSKYNLKDLEGACKDWQKSSLLGNTQATKQLEKYCR